MRNKLKVVYSKTDSKLIGSSLTKTLREIDVNFYNIFLNNKKIGELIYSEDEMKFTFCKDFEKEYCISEYLKKHSSKLKTIVRQKTFYLSSMFLLWC